MSIMTRNDSSMVGDSKWELQGSPVGPVPLTGMACGSLTATQLPVALGNGMLVAPGAVGMLVNPDSSLSVAPKIYNSSMVCDSKWPVAPESERLAGGTCNVMEAVGDPRECMKSEGNLTKFDTSKGGNAVNFFPDAFSPVVEIAADQAVEAVINSEEKGCFQAEAVGDSPSCVESEGNSRKFDTFKGGNAVNFFPEAFSNSLEIDACEGASSDCSRQCPRDAESGGSLAKFGTLEGEMLSFFSGGVFETFGD